MKAYKMPSESLQALNSDYSELHSPDSLYTKDLNELLPEEIKLSCDPVAVLHLNNTYQLLQDEHVSAPAEEQTSMQDLMEVYTSNHCDLLCSPEFHQDPNVKKGAFPQQQSNPGSVPGMVQSLEESILPDPENSLSQFPSSTSPSDMVNGVYERRQPSPVASPDTTVFSETTNTHTALQDINVRIKGETGVVGSSDVNTQMSLCQRSEAMCLRSDLLNSAETDPLWVLLPDGKADTSPLVSPHKARKSSVDTDAPSSNVDSTTSNTFDLGCAVSSAQFVFTKFGSEVPGVFTFGGQTSTMSQSSSGDAVVRAASNAVTSFSRSGVDPMVTVEGGSQMSPPSVPHAPPAKEAKEATLNSTFPSKVGNIELKVVVQPEEQHRARYMTEGSRGAIKDKSQNGHPVIQLKGYDKPVTIKMFIGTDSGRIKPHGFYQACRVCGKNSTLCSERDISGTTVIEVVAEPKEDMRVRVDCVGILKLRNADVEQRIGLQRSKKKSTRVRMVFRADVPKPDGTILTLQTSSTAISCTQPAGQPEVCRKSMSKCSVQGGEDLFIIGKNFTKGSKVLVQERDADDKVLWSAEAPVEMDYFQPTHLICKLPAYKNQNILEEAKVNLMVQCNDRISEVSDFAYTPAGLPIIKSEEPAANKVTPMDTDPQTLAFSVSPIAVALNKLYEKCSSGSSNGAAVLPTILIQSIQPASSTPLSSNITSNPTSTTFPMTTTDMMSSQTTYINNPTNQPLQQQPITMVTNATSHDQQGINVSVTEPSSNIISQLQFNTFTQQSIPSNAPVKDNGVNLAQSFNTPCGQQAPQQTNISMKDNNIGHQVIHNSDLMKQESVVDCQMSVVKHARQQQLTTQNNVSLPEAFAVPSMSSNKVQQNDTHMLDTQQVPNKQMNTVYCPQVKQNNLLDGVLNLQQGNIILTQTPAQNVGLGQQNSQNLVFNQQTLPNVVFGQQTSHSVVLGQQNSQNVGVCQQNETSQNVALDQKTLQNLLSVQQSTQNVSFGQQNSMNASQQSSCNVDLGRQQDVVDGQRTLQNMISGQQHKVGLGQHQNMNLDQQRSPNIGLSQQQNVGLGQQHNVGLGQQQNMDLGQQSFQNMGIGQQQNVSLGQQQNVGLGQQQNMDRDQQSLQNIGLSQQQNIGLGQQTLQNLVCSQQSSQNIGLGQTSQNVVLAQQDTANQSQPLQLDVNSMQILNVNSIDVNTSQVLDADGCFLSPMTGLDDGYQDPVIRGSQAQCPPTMLMNMKAGAGLAEGQKSLCPPTSVVKAEGHQAAAASPTTTADWQSPTQQQVPSGSDSGKPFPSLSLQDVETLLGVLGANTSK